MTEPTYRCICGSYYHQCAGHYKRTGEHCCTACAEAGMRASHPATNTATIKLPDEPRPTDQSVADQSPTTNNTQEQPTMSNAITFGMRMTDNDAALIQLGLINLYQANQDQRDPDPHLSIVIDQILQRMQYRSEAQEVSIAPVAEKVLDKGERGEHTCSTCGHGRQAHSAHPNTYEVTACTTMNLGEPCPCSLFASEMGPLAPVNEYGPPDRGYKQFIPSADVKVELDDIMKQLLD